MLARIVALAAFLLSLVVSPVVAQQGGTGGKDLIETRSAEPSGQNLYTSSHALIIGVNNYPNLPKRLQLSFGVSDATAMRDMLVNNYGFPSDQVVVLTNDKATLANIRIELARLSSPKRVKADDRILVYFSGHGQTVKLANGGDMGFLIPSDAKIDMSAPNDIDPYLETCLPMKQLWDYLGPSPAKHVCVIADACFSGMMATSRSVGMSSDTVAAMLARPARQVLTAGGVGESTLERPELGHGVFTYKLLGELKARSADKGKIFSLMDLYTALQTSVSNMTGGKQIPKFGNIETEGQVLFCSGTALMASNSTGTGTGGTGATGGSGESGGTTGTVKDPNDHHTTTNPTDTHAKLTVTSSPSGATLFIDGVKKGKTPYTMQVDLKEASDRDYTIRIEAKGYIPTETTTTLKPGDDLNVPVDLKKVRDAPPAVTTATVTIDSDPQGAAVFVDGTQVGMTPYPLTVDLTATKQQRVKIRVELDGFVPAQASPTVHRGDSISVPFKLKPVPVKQVKPPKQRHIKTLALSALSTLAGKVPVDSIMFSPDGKHLAVSGLDFSLTLYDTNGGNPRKIDAPKNTIVQITPDWKKILMIKLTSDGQNTWVSVTAKDSKTLNDIGTPVRLDVRPDTAVEDAYVGNGRLIICGSIGKGDVAKGFVTIADFAKGEAKTLTGGFRMTEPSSSADDSTYAVYMEPSSLRAEGSFLVIPSDLTQQPSQVATTGCNSCAGIELSDDGRLVAVTCQRVTEAGSDIIGTRIYDVASGQQTQFLPKLRVAALIGHGARLLGWRSQIGGPIMELLDAKTGDGLGEAPGGEVWLSRDEKLAAQATPDGTITVYRLTQP